MTVSRELSNSVVLIWIIVTHGSHGSQIFVSLFQRLTFSGQIGDTEFLLIDFSFVVDIGARPNGVHGKSLFFRSNDGALNEEFVLALDVQRRIFFESLKHDRDIDALSRFNSA